jgi:hypothetical protein
LLEVSGAIRAGEGAALRFPRRTALARASHWSARMTNTRFYSRAARLLRLMRWGVALPLTLLPAACVSETGPDDSEPVESTELELTNTELIFGWAPILYQNTTQVSGGTGSNGRGDFMTSFDYDGDFNGQNNWDNMDSFSLPAKMYAAISESSTHYFIYYTMFHPRSWINSSFYDEHENDAESAVVLVRKDGTQFGKLEAVLTAFHSEGKAYRAATDVVDNPNNSITPGMITTEAWGFRSHPQLFMEAEGHGLAGCPSSVNCGISNANMIKYVPFDPSQPLQQPALPIQGTEQVGYRLIDLGDLFKRRFDRPTFFNAASMAGD